MPQITVYVTKEVELLLKNNPTLNRSKLFTQAVKKAASKLTKKEER